MKTPTKAFVKTAFQPFSNAEDRLRDTGMPVIAKRVPNWVEPRYHRPMSSFVLGIFYWNEKADKFLYEL